jgi:hypothetical protein
VLPVLTGLMGSSCAAGFEQGWEAVVLPVLTGLMGSSCAAGFDRADGKQLCCRF